MASVPSGRGNGGSNAFDFGSDDVLCSYEEGNSNHDSSSVTHTDPTKDFYESRMARKSIVPAASYRSLEDSWSQEVIATVEKSMKTHADNLMRSLEGISSRLSQLELYCYNLDKSIGAMRSDLDSDHEEADSKLKSLDKHLQEVHRSVQILRDKQELAETQKELAKLQLIRKESSSSSHLWPNEERSSPSSMYQKKIDNASDTHNQELALALPHQVAPRQQPVAAASSYQAPAPNASQATQQPHYYIMPTSVSNPQAVAQLPQNQYLPSDPQYRIPQSTSSSQVTQSAPVQQFSQYQQLHHQHQQLPTQLPQQVQPLSTQSQMRPPLTNAYTPYPASQATNPLPTETLANSMPMQIPYSGIPPQGSSRGDAMPYGYSMGGRTFPQQPPPQQMKGSFSAQPGDVYGTGVTRTMAPPASSYMVYDGESARAHHPPQPSYYAQAGYPPTSASLQNPAPHNLMIQSSSQSQFTRSHPYNELVEKFVSMGYRGDHVVSIIQRMEETKQPIDFNTLHDRLNVHNSVGHQRGWSG
ncbi:vacuolar protein sorting-associated protein 27 [Cajanus cajan]|uniref:vacuolar protein sorting-associated protein 27 n=1 Tax=Cajanus cajan TaxID=3821 RepID=UPI00098D8D69|nr:vacuolar protein sorting-associated protein 27 [Cajanus cajan]